MTGNIAHFEAKTSWDPGYGDIVEIFRDDRPFWDEFTGAKTHFSFGTRKAKWILMFMDVIKDFYDSSGVLPGTQHSPKVISRDTVTLSWHPNFKKGRHTIEKPYLELSAKGGKMGFGLTKAEALILLHEDLKKFVRESA